MDSRDELFPSIGRNDLETRIYDLDLSLTIVGKGIYIDERITKGFI